MKRNRLIFVLVSLFLAALTLMSSKIFTEYVSAKTLFNGLITIPHIIAIIFVLIAIAIPFITLELDKVEGREIYSGRAILKSTLTAIIGLTIIVLVAVIFHQRLPFLTEWERKYLNDLTSNKINSLNEATVKALQELKEPIQIICVPEIRYNFCGNNRHLLDLFEKANPKYVSYTILNLNITEDLAAYQTIMATLGAREPGFLAVIKGGDLKTVRKVEYVEEGKIINAILNQIKNKRKIYFAKGFGEPSTGFDGLRNYGQLVDILKRFAFEVESFDLAAATKIPDDATALVLGGNDTPYPQNVDAMLKDYIAAGGNILLTVNPFAQVGLKEFLGTFGIEIQDLLVVGEGNRSDKGQLLAKRYPLQPPFVLSDFSYSSPIVRELANSNLELVIPIARPVVYKAPENALVKIQDTKLFEASHAASKPLTQEDMQAAKLGNVVITGNPDSPSKYEVAREFVFEDIEKLQPQNAATNKDAKPKKAMLVVFGFDIASAASMQIPNDPRLFLGYFALARLAGDQELISIQAKDYGAKRFRFERKPENYVGFFAFLLPILTAILGIVTWNVRRAS